MISLSSCELFEIEHIILMLQNQIAQNISEITQNNILMSKNNTFGIEL